VGDRLVTAGGLGGGTVLGGLTIARSFDIDPYFFRYPSMSYEGAATMPTTVDVYMNDTRIRRLQLSPGVFDLRDLPMAAGAGTARIVAREADGREQRVDLPYYFSRRVLRAGVSDYTYSLGFERAAPGSASWNYGRLAALASHRYGFTDAVTAGFHAEADTALRNAGGVIDTRSRIGEVEVAGAVSRADGAGGAAGSLSYDYAGREGSVGIRLGMTSARYATLSLASSAERVRAQAAVTMAVRLGRVGAISLQYAIARGASRGATASTASVVSQVTLTSRASLRVSASRTSSAGGLLRPTSAVTVSVSVHPGKSMAGSVSVRADRGNANVSYDVGKSVPAGHGFGYHVQGALNGATAGRAWTSGRVTYGGALGSYDLQLTSFNGRLAGAQRINGSMVIAGGRVMFARPVSDAFAVVRVPGAAGVRIYANSQEIGRTDAHGDVVVPTLISHYGNALRVEELDVPPGMSVNRREQTIAPGLRGGALVLFPVARMLHVTGHLVVLRDGHRTIPSYGELRVSDRRLPFESPIGKDGEFDLENPPAGRLPVEIEFADGVCAFELAIPVSTANAIDLGTVTCVIAK
jgi:outer membrane usher protein